MMNASHALVVLDYAHKIYVRGQHDIVDSDIGALMGFSGCGKSTLLHQIGGIDRPTQGRVMVGVTKLKNS